MNLFWKKLFGSIISTEKFQQQQNDLEVSIKRYYRIAESEQLAEYRKLKEVIDSSDFQKTKSLLQKTKYKDTDEYKTISRFEKLQKDKSLQCYFEVEKSLGLKKYLDYKANLKHGETSESKALEQEMKSYAKSKDFKIYTQYHNSAVLKEYADLKEKVSTTDFRNENNFWKNKNRWIESKEYKTEERYETLKKNSDIAFYLENEPHAAVKFVAKEMVFSASFDDGNLDRKLWNPGYFFHPPLIGNYSLINELQANNCGKNTSVINGALRIATKKEKAVSKAWHPTKGFIEKEFDYTADVLQTGDCFCRQNGVFQIKMRASGSPHHVFWLGAKDIFPRIQIAHIHEKEIKVGVLFKDNKESETIKGLNPADYLIYTLIWNDKELIWKINNYEVFRTKNHIPKKEMYLGLNSFIPEKQKAGEGLFEVDWIRIYAN